MKTRTQLRYAVWTLFAIVGGLTLYNHLTNKEADNGAACSVIGLLLLFAFEFAYAAAEAIERRRSGGK